MKGEYVLYISFKVVDIHVRRNQSIDVSRALSTSLVPFYAETSEQLLSVCGLMEMWECCLPAGDLEGNGVGPGRKESGRQ